MASYNPIGKAMFTAVSATYSYNELLSDGDDVVSRSATLATAAGIQKRGAILSWAAATGIVTVPALATDCNCILVDDTDASGGNAVCGIYVGGKFKADAVIWPGALGHAAVTDNLRNFDIQIESVVFTDGSLVRSVPTALEEKNAKAVIEENLHRKKAPPAEAEPQPEPRDSPWAFLTAEEREKNPELAEIHDREKAEGEEKHGGNSPKPSTSFTPPNTPPKHKSSGD